MKTLKIILVLTLALFASNSFAGFTYDFEAIQIVSPVSAAIAEAQMSLEVSDLGSNQALFTLSNSGPQASTIAQIYFDNASGELLGIASLIEGTGVDFSYASNTGTLPGWNVISPSFAKPADYAVTANPPPASSGINPLEELGIVFDIDTSFAALIDDINSGEVRVGIHVTSFANGESEALVNTPGTPPVVPTPGAIVLGSIGVAIVGWVRRRKTT